MKMKQLLNLTLQKYLQSRLNTTTILHDMNTTTVHHDMINLYMNY